MVRRIFTRSSTSKLSGRVVTFSTTFSFSSSQLSFTRLTTIELSFFHTTCIHSIRHCSGWLHSPPLTMSRLRQQPTLLSHKLPMFCSNCCENRMTADSLAGSVRERHGQACNATKVALCIKTENIGDAVRRPCLVATGQWDV